MFDNLGQIAWGIIVFAVAIVLGSVILTQFGNTYATCTMAACGAAGTYNKSANTCSNATSSSCSTPEGVGYTNANYLNNQLGSTGGGLASYTPLVVISIIGFAILGLFFMNKRKQY